MARRRPLLRCNAAGGLDHGQVRATYLGRSGHSGKAFLLIGVLAVAGCAAAARPVLYPNAHLSAVGQAQADVDIAECREMAEGAGASGGAGEGEQAAKSGAVGGAIGGATGAVGGAILGRPGTGAAVGAATGATAGLLRSLFRRSEPSQAYRGFVDRCLRERGYDPVGWE
jgi:outer membrane lipoprotein SlyB